MFDYYFDLMTKLREKDNVSSDSDYWNIQQDIKRVADKIKKQLGNDEAIFDAAFCYYVSGYYVQAQALAIHAPINNVHRIQKWVLYFLAKNFKELRRALIDITQGDKFQDEVIQHDITSNNLSSHEVVERIVTVKIAQGLLDVISFIENGNEEVYDNAIRVFLLCQKLLCKVGEWQVWWWIECLKIIAKELFENSLWQTLKPMRENPTKSEIISKYIVENYKGANIIELWRTQIESLPKINDPERCSFCISVPTSAGKTKAAELAVLRFLLDYWGDSNTKCVYIAPLRKLCQEVEEAFSKVFGTFKKGIVSTFYGGYEVDIFDEYFFKSTRILIVTPEKLDGMLRQYPDLASQIKLVIADEGHLIGGEDPKYRFLLERLIYVLNKKLPDKTKKSRIILISGVLPNIEDFADLVSGSRKNIIKIDWRPIDEPKIGIWAWNGEIFITNTQELPPPTLPYIQRPSILLMDNYKDQNNFDESVVRVGIECAKWSETLVFSASKKDISSKKFLSLLINFAKDKPLGSFKPLPSAIYKYREFSYLLENGIAIHHANVPTGVKREIEKRISSGDIKLLFASPTLAQGVNIPFHSILIYNLHHDYHTPISDAVFWNLVGRVGRPISQIRKTIAKLEPPTVIFLVNISKSSNHEDKQNIRRTNQLLENQTIYRVASPFLDFLKEIRNKATLPVAEIISGLAEKHNLHDIVGELASTPWRELTFEKYLISLDNQLLDLLHEVFPEVELTLDWLQQLSKELVDLFVKASVIKPEDLEYISDAILARLKFISKYIPREKRRQDYLLGLPYSDCEKIKQNVEELLVWYQGCTNIFTNNRAFGIENFVNLINYISDLSICSHKSNDMVSSQNLLPGFDPKPIETARKEFFSYWLTGTNHEVLQKTLNLFCPKTDFSQYLETTIERELPWGVSAITRYLSIIAKDRGLNLPRDLDYLPSMVKYGTNSKISCHLKKLNISRIHAISIANVYISKLPQGGNSDMEDIFQNDFQNAIKSLQYLTDSEIKRLEIDKKTIIKIEEIRERYKNHNLEGEPEFPPLDLALGELS